MLDKGFTTRKGHPAAGMAKEDLVATDLVHDGIDIHLLTGKLQGFFRTGGHTRLTEGAKSRIEISRRRVEAFGADRPAGMAPPALVSVIGQLPVLGPAFRVGAPLAPEAATGQKDGGADPVTVMDGIVLHLQDRSVGAVFYLVSSCHGPSAR